MEETWEWVKQREERDSIVSLKELEYKNQANLVYHRSLVGEFTSSNLLQTLQNIK